ncbi:DNA damage-responsive transcriptional repressor RPH1 [Colletotrichum chlorophyti]|uniref:[histone H3]-trimethyl-L-lysine(9) demethylase n=1 Tax=Colletotrichum chlorophyti TaxID=708187 RepID=A0A1Q8RQN4_9PEZI|nr:DNA damage-responsive transcriptional repressor RPH1 [Colletotrichum chlorophyti]
MSTDAASAPILEPAPVPAQSTGDHDEQQPALGQIECAKPAFLHSPPDSNNAPKSEQSDSELSDLDDDAVDPTPPKQDEAQVEDDIGEVLPDHWSGTVPVFRPTMHQFKDFKLFMTKIDHYGMKSGIVKIIPPSEWKESLPKLDNLVKQIRVREPIKQDIMGSNGTYRQVNIVHQRSYNIPQWRQLCDQSEHQPPARRGERRANVEKPKTRSAPKPRTELKSTPSAPKKRGRGRPRRGKAKAKDQDEEEDAQEEEEKRPITPVSPRPDAEAEVKKEEVVDSVEDPGMDIDDDEPPTVGRMGRMGGARQAKPKTQSVSARRKYSKREGSAMIDEEAFKDFDYQMDVSDYTPERCEELERIYWKTLTYAPPLYGADLMGTLFDESTEIWNLNKLPNLLDVLGTKVPGVNTAYLYLGMWKATFAWHLEDVDLYSINYLHFGAPKQWYSISQADARRFEAAMKNIWPTDAKACDQFLRHKGFLISPSHLKQHYNITVNKCVSYPGEFVVTYPYGYHSGYNLGYNCAEAVNFALDSWLPMGKIAKRCECAQAQDSVWVDVYDIERKLRGEETEYEETDDDDDDDEEDEDMDDVTGLPSPPNSNNSAIKPARKRKRAAGDKDGKTKVKKIRLKVKTRAEPICCLCPNDITGAEILPTDDGRKGHRMCALYLPETYIDTVDDKEIIANVANINKERLDLKCLYCRSKKGACFQCSQKKCARAYHATCAAAAGVFVEEAEVPVFGEDGTEYKEQAFEFSCRFHRTKRDRKYDGGALEDDERIRDAAAALKKGEICQMQYYKGDIFAGIVVENRTDEQTLLLDIIPNGDRFEVEWKWLLLPDPSDFHLPKASAKAIPMPSSQKAKDQLNAKRPADETPRKDALFVEGFTWAEFHPCDTSRNPNQVKVDLSKENQVWHYLGKTSTEAKAQYSDDPVKQQHNPKSNFLDTIPKPPKPVSASIAQRKVSATPLQPSPISTPGTSVHAGIKPEKPYVYKPRKPVETNYAGVGSFTTQHFTPKASPSPAHAGQQLQIGSDARYPVAAGHFAQQRFTPDVHPSHATRFSPAGQAYYATPNNPQRVSPYSTPAAQTSSAAQSAQPTWSTPSQKPRQSSHSSAQNSTAQNHRRYSAAPTPSFAMKYPFFQVNHNRSVFSEIQNLDNMTYIFARDSKTYRTPYAPWGGFTNGYEGNLRAHLMRTSPEAFFKNRKGSVQAGTPKQSPSARPQASTHSGPYYNTLNTTMPQGSIGMYGVKTAAPSQSPALQQATQGPSRTQYASSPSQNHNFQPSATGNGSMWPAQQSQSAPLHPAIRPQYGAWVNQSPSTAPHATPQQALQQTSHQTPQQTPQPTSVTDPQPTTAKAQPSAKSTAPKVQYKIPEKQTPVPLPAKYLAALGKLASSTTPSKLREQSVGEASHGSSPSPASRPSAEPSRPMSATGTKIFSSHVDTLQPPTTFAGRSTQETSQASETPLSAPLATYQISQTPVPVPQTPSSISNSRMPFTNQSSTKAFPQPRVQPPTQASVPPIQHYPQGMGQSQSRTEHNSLNPAEILAQIATQPRMNPPTPTTPSHPSMPSQAPPSIGSAPPYQAQAGRQEIMPQSAQQSPQHRHQNYGPVLGHSQPAQYQQQQQHQYQTYGPPPPTYQPPPHKQQQYYHPPNPAPYHQPPQASHATEGEVPLPEVPADSTALVERMMQNLRRAAFQG